MSLGAGELKEIDAHLARIINLLERDRSLGISTATSVGPSPQPTNFISAPATDLLVTTESDSDSSSSHKFPTSTSEWVEYDPHTHKKIERKVSVDEYPDSDIDQLIAGIDITSIQDINNVPAQQTPPAVSSGVSAPAASKLRGAQSSTKKSWIANNYTAWVVYQGAAPGIYSRWDDCKAEVHRVKGAIHKGFPTRLQAERSYALAGALGCLHTISKMAPYTKTRLPMPDVTVNLYNAAPSDFLEFEWHVVFEGIRPGIYPTWNFSAMQTSCIPGARHKKYGSKEAAEHAFEEAVRNSETRAL